MFALIFSVIFILFGSNVSQNLNFMDATCTYNDTGNSYYLDKNMIVKFHSPNYPDSMVYNWTYVPTCKAQFQIIDSNYRLWLTFYNGYLKEIVTYDGPDLATETFFDSYSNVYSEFLPITTQTQILNFEGRAKSDWENSETDWEGFEAVVLPYNPSTSTCPFASDSIDFLSLQADTVIPIASSFGRLYSNATQCQWNFDTFGGGTISPYLKIVIKDLYVNENATLELLQNDQVIQKFDGSNHIYPQVYYFYGDPSRFQLIWNDTGSDNSGVAEASFTALVSVVSVPYEYPYSPCDTRVDDKNVTTIFWRAYQSNQGCEYPLTIAQDEEYLLSVATTFFERNVDTLAINYLNSDTILQQYARMRVTNALSSSFPPPVLRFHADGSIEGGGFEVTMTKLDCQCPNEILMIPCGDLIELQPQTCDDQVCRVKLVTNASCPDSLFQININTAMRTFIDSFQISVNGKVQETFANSQNIYRFYTPTDQVEISYSYGIYNSPIQNDFRRLSITASMIVANEVYNITAPPLTKNSPVYSINAADIEIGFRTICTTENDTLELYFSGPYDALDNYILYDGTGLTNFVGALSTLSKASPFKPIPSTSGCFTILASDDEGSNPVSELFFRLKTTQSQNCLDANNIFALQPSTTTIKVEAMASGYCEIIILPIIPGMLISTMNGTLGKDIVLRSTVNQRKFLTMNTSEASAYQNLLLYTPSLSITLPPSTSLVLNFKNLTKFIEVTDGQKGVLASPGFGGLKDEQLNRVFSSPFYHLSSGELGRLMSFNLTVKEVTGYEKVVAFNGVENQTLVVNETITIDGLFLEILSSDAYLKTDHYLIEYEAAVIPDLPLTSTSTPLMSTKTSGAPSSSQSTVDVSTKVTRYVPVTDNIYTTTLGSTTFKVDATTSASIKNFDFMFFVVVLCTLIFNVQL